MGPELSCYVLSCSQRIKIVQRFCHKIATNSQQTCTSPTTRKSFWDDILWFFVKNCASEYITEFSVLAHNYWNTKRSVCSLKIVKCTELAGLPRNYGKKHQFSDWRNWRSTFPPSGSDLHSISRAGVESADFEEWSDSKASNQDFFKRSSAILRSVHQAHIHYSSPTFTMNDRTTSSHKNRQKLQSKFFSSSKCQILTVVGCGVNNIWRGEWG